MRVLTVLPPREVYAEGHAGAIALLVSRLALPEDRVAGSVLQGKAPLSGGVFVPLERVGWLPARLGYAWACLKVARALGVDLVEVHNRPDLASLLAWFVRVRLVLHNDPCGMRGARTARVRRRLARRALVCGVSRWVVDRFSEGCGPVRAEVQPNCMEMSAVPEGRERGQVVLFAGRVVADKGVDAFVACWERVRGDFPGWRAVIVGADRFGPDSPETLFLAGLRPLSARAGVEMVGYRPHAQVLEAMAAAEVVVVPSRWAEPFGMTALEAMACGAAVIASPVGGLPEVVGDAAVLAGPDDLEGALCRVLGDRALRERLGQLGRERAGEFGVEAARERLRELRRMAVEADRQGRV